MFGIPAHCRKEPGITPECIHISLHENHLGLPNTQLGIGYLRGAQEFLGI